MDRREHDRLATIQLFRHQDLFLKSLKREAWIFGANRSGKTDALAAWIASMMRFGRPDPRPAFLGNGDYILDRSVKLWAVSLTTEMSRNILQPKIFDNGQGLGSEFMIPMGELKDGTEGWNITNQTLKTKNGSICQFKTCEQGPKAFQGEALDGIGYDEVPAEEVYRESAIRIGAGRQLLIRGAATILPPPGVAGGVSWMYSKKVRPWLDAGGNEDTKDLDIFTASIRDNHTLLPEEISKLESLYVPGSQEHRIRILGELLPSIGGALVYPHFNRQYHVNDALAPEKDGIRRPNVDRFLPLVLCVDFNPEAGVWLVCQRRAPGVFCVLDEISLERSDIANMVHEFRLRYPTHGAELWIYGDATGRRRSTQTGESDFHTIMAHLQGYPVPVRVFLPDVNPPVNDRVNAVNIQLQPPDGIKRVEFSPLCEKTILSFESTKYKANGKIDKKSDRSDGPEALGYWISYVAPVSQYASHGSPLRAVRSPSYVTKRGPAKTGVFPATLKMDRRGNVRAIRRVR